MVYLAGSVNDASLFCTSSFINNSQNIIKILFLFPQDLAPAQI